MKGRAEELHKMSLKRAGKTHYQSYEKKGNFNSAGHKRQGDNRIMSYPDVSKSDMNPHYAGGTDSDAMGNIPE